MLAVAVARSSSDDNAIRYVLSVFVDDVIFSHNGPNTDAGLESATQRIIYRNSLDGAAKLRIMGRSLLSPIALLLSHSFNLVPMYDMRWLNPAKRGNNSDSLAKRYGDVQRFFIQKCTQLSNFSIS